MLKPYGWWGGITRQHTVRLWHLLPDVAQTLVAAGPDLIDRFGAGAALVTRAQQDSDWHASSRIQSP